jgi:hypothetical protein
MAKPSLSPEQFVAEVNRRLPEHHLYKPGMRVFLYPRGSTDQTASGTDFEGPDETRSVMADIESQVRQEYEVFVPPRAR